jgi:hypothetical protein
MLGTTGADEDELEDARQDLIRAGGNPEGMMQRLRAEHEAGRNASASTPAPSQNAPDLESSSLAGQVRAWLWLKTKQERLESARNEAKGLAKTLTGQHDLEYRVKRRIAETNREGAGADSTGYRPGRRLKQACRRRPLAQTFLQ